MFPPAPCKELGEPSPDLKPKAQGKAKAKSNPAAKATAKAKATASKHPRSPQKEQTSPNPQDAKQPKRMNGKQKDPSLETTGESEEMLKSLLEARSLMRLSREVLDVPRC